jgi:hypothetical protein
MPHFNRLCRFRVGLLAQNLDDGEGIYFETLPPGLFMSRLMQLPMMAVAECCREPIAELQANGSGLCKAKNDAVESLLPADQISLLGDEFLDFLS